MSQGEQSFFDKLGWWSVPICAVIGAFAPFLTRSGRKAFMDGNYSWVMSIGFAVAGAGASALLTLRSRIQSKTLRGFVMVFGILIIAVAATFVVLEFLKE